MSKVSELASFLGISEERAAKAISDGLDVSVLMGGWEQIIMEDVKSQESLAAEELSKVQADLGKDLQSVEQVLKKFSDELSDRFSR